ncbi:hypothetical protein K449DRAFT_461711 [Hypoxylon sp. EC38]|nr:hypothetical protein K449DRAFT_461711 [Hypoxylon sp. EC38]
MASDEAGGSASTTEAEPASFTLHLVSPSVGIPQPLILEVPTDTTVKQLKERIRNAVNTRPSDEAQRLIHRGRLLSRDSETMTDIFGREALQSTDHQTLHLALREIRDHSENRGTSSSTPNNPFHSSTFPRPSVAPTGLHAPPQPYSQHHATSIFNQPQAQQARIGVPQYHGVAFGFPQGMPIPGQIPGAMIIPANLQAQQYGPYMRAANAQGGGPHLNQRVTAQGAQDTSAANPRVPGGVASPFQPMDATRTTVREGLGPDGVQWRVTMNETFIHPTQQPGGTESPFSTPDASNPGSAQPRLAPNGGQLSYNEVQNFLRAGDVSSATRVMTDAMRRNASSPSLANLASSQAHRPIAPGVTTPLIPSRAGSANATPDPLRAFGQTRPMSTSQPQTQTQSSQGTPEVYILSSPNGPRALLLNNNLETYFTPQVRAGNQPFGLSVPQRPLSAPFVNPFNFPHLTPTPTIQPIRRHTTGPQPSSGSQTQHPPQQQQHGLPQPPQHQPQPQIGHAIARPDNPQVQAIRIAQLWPYVWMIIRLGLFIWWLTSPTSSWSRWFTVISIAIVLFLLNAGFLNPLGEQIWAPFRRYLDNLIPLADDHQDPQAPAGAGNAQGGNDVDAANPGQQQRELNPADTAARLVQQRRNANANWLMDQARRLERAGILFLASIAPGVAERHIAQVEAEARAERRRREAEAAAATVAAEQSEGPQDSETQQNTEHNEGQEQNQVGEGSRNDESNEQGHAEEEPLIAA